MELPQLRYFLDVAETEHVTRSAERLHIAQPSLTRSIHNLEEELGVPLFVPRGRNIALSEYGRYLVKKLAPLVAELDGLPELMRNIANLKNETIHLNVLAASTFLTGAIVEYKRTHPDIKFEFLQYTPEDVYDIQVATRLIPPQGDHPAENCFICHEKIFLAVPNTERFRSRTGIRLSEVMHENFISLSDARQFRNICDKLCQHMGFKPNIVFESDSPTAVRNMIASNIGIGFWPEFTWGELTGSQILPLPIEDEGFVRELVVTHRMNKTDNRSVLEFFRFLEDFYRRGQRHEISLFHD